jgi:transposase-like protein
MANILNTDKQIAIIASLAEGSSIRSIERITGVHRDTIMRLGVKMGQGCMGMSRPKTIAGTAPQNSYPLKSGL